MVLDVPVERRPEAVGLVGGDERIEEDERVVGMERVGRDGLLPAAFLGVAGLPLGVRRGPVPEVGRDFLEVHPV